MIKRKFEVEIKNEALARNIASLKNKLEAGYSESRKLKESLHIVKIENENLYLKKEEIDSCQTNFKFFESSK